MRRTMALTAVTLVAAAALAGCGGSQHDSHPMTSSSSSAGSPDASDTFNQADVTFATDMITHHRQAVEMADLADGRTASPEVLDLAAQISAAQQPEIDLMSGWLQAWGAPIPEDMSGMDMSGSMPGMMSMADMERLEGSSSDAFDRQFLSMMIAHHGGAVQMANTEIEHGENAGAITLAEEVVSAQTAEIATMRALLGRGGST